MFRILVVCTGNICRSPMGEGILRALLAERGLGARAEVRSAGTWATKGAAASRNGVRTAAKRGIDLEGHRSSPLSHSLLHDADLILTMEPLHLEEILSQAPEVGGRTFIVSLFADPEHGSPLGVEDPIGGDEEAYEYTYEEIAGLMRKALSRIERMIEEKDAAAAREERPSN